MSIQPHSTLQQLLDKLETEVSAASVHGLWCGRLAAGDDYGSNDWWRYTLRVVGQEGDVQENLLSALKAVANFTDQHLQQDSFEFEPWLPAENVACSLRVSALSEWCQGFIEGLSAVLGKRLMAAPDDIKELLRDLLDIGEVDPDVAGDEEDEKQLLELTEFVKIAALNIWHEFANQHSVAAEEKTKPTLH